MDGRTFVIDETTFRKSGLYSAYRFFGERFTPAGLWFLLGSCGWLLSGINSLDLQAFVPVMYAIALWLLALCALFLVRPRLHLAAHHEGRTSAGETLRVDFEVGGPRGRADRYRIVPFRAPKLLQVEPLRGVALPAPEPGRTMRVSGGLHCPRRGIYTLPGWRVETDFPFGLMRAQQTFAQPSRVLVYPRFTPLAHLVVPPGRRFHPGGVALATHGGDSFEFLGNRDYREGDALRNIDWRATARLQRPVVREYREEYFLRVAVVLDTHLNSTSGDRGQRDEEAFETAVSLCASVGDYMARQDYIVDILAAGPNLYHLTAGRGLAYLDQILDILACVEANPDEPFSVLLPEIAANLSKINTIVCIFLDWNEARREFLGHLEKSGAGIKAIVVRDEPCTLDPASDRFAPCLHVVGKAAYAAGDFRL